MSEKTDERPDSIMSPQRLPSDLVLAWGCLALSVCGVDVSLFAPERWHSIGAVFLLRLSLGSPWGLELPLGFYTVLCRLTFLYISAINILLCHLHSR